MTPDENVEIGSIRPIDYVARLQKVRALLAKHKADLLLVSSTPNVEHLIGPQSERSRATLAITPQDAIVFRGRKVSAAPPGCFSVHVIDDISSLPDILQNTFSRVCIESDALAAEVYLAFVKSIGPSSVWPVDSELNDACALDAGAIDRLSSGEALLHRFESVARAGVARLTEAQLVGEMESFRQDLVGLDSLSVATRFRVAYGKNSDNPLHNAGDAQLKEAEHALVSLQISIDGYLSIRTFTLFPFGFSSAKLQRAQEIVFYLQQSMRDQLFGGASPSVAVESARATLNATDILKLAPHAPIAASGLGLQPFTSLEGSGIRAALIEPGLYIRGLGGVRFGRTYILRPDSKLVSSNMADEETYKILPSLGSLLSQSERFFEQPLFVDSDEMDDYSRFLIGDVQYSWEGGL